jgi:hypothetical protein
MNRRAITFRTTLALSGAFFVLVALPSHFAQAETACSFLPKIQKVQDFLASNAAKINTADALSAQAFLRKEALRAVIQCAQEDLKGHEVEVETVKPAIPDMDRVRDQIIQKIKDQYSYYDARLQEVNTLGVRGTQESAKNIRSWREGVLAPLLKSAENFILWNKNQEVIASSKARLDNVSKSFEVLKLGNDKELLDLFITAREKFESANEANDRAKQLLLKLGPADYTEMLIKETLTDLSDSYKALIDLSDKANEKLKK